MKDWVDEVLSVISYSKRAPCLLLAGSMLAVAALLLGGFLASSYIVPSAHPELGQVVVSYISKRSGKVAGLIMVGATIATCWQYQRDKARYYRRMGLFR